MIKFGSLLRLHLDICDTITLCTRRLEQTWTYLILRIYSSALAADFRLTQSQLLQEHVQLFVEAFKVIDNDLMLGTTLV